MANNDLFSAYLTKNVPLKEILMIQGDHTLLSKYLRGWINKDYRDIGTSHILTALDMFLCPDRKKELGDVIHLRRALLFYRLACISATSCVFGSREEQRERNIDRLAEHGFSMDKLPEGKLLGDVWQDAEDEVMRIISQMMTYWAE